MEVYITSFIIISVGLTFSLAGIYFIFIDKKIKSEGRKTEATVIDLKQNTTTDGTTYTQIIEFRNRKGNVIVQELGHSSSIKPKKRIPFKIPIYYLKRGDSYQILLANNGLFLALWYAFTIIGSSLLVIYILHIFEVITILE